MRYLVGCVLMLALGGLPLSVSAQADESRIERWHPEAFEGEEPPQEPALRLEQDRAGLRLYPQAAGVGADVPLKDMQLRVRRARGGLIGTSLITGVGGALMIGGVLGVTSCVATFPPEPCPAEAALVAGYVVTAAGVVGMLIAGPLLGVRKRDLRDLQQADYRKPRRLQWDLAHSRLVF